MCFCPLFYAQYFSSLDLSRIAPISMKTKIEKVNTNQRHSHSEKYVYKQNTEISESVAVFIAKSNHQFLVILFMISFVFMFSFVLLAIWLFSKKRSHPVTTLRLKVPPIRFGLDFHLHLVLLNIILCNI